MTESLPQVVIVGAGFAGLQAARSLATAPVRVVLVDRRNYHLFQPLLYQVAAVAVQQANMAVKNIKRLLKQQPPETFAYKNPGMLATIGRNAAVAQIGTWQVQGFVAWLLWIVIHVVRLIGFRNRVLVMINWAWDYLFYERAVRLIMPNICRLH